jgi:hypothetical protein
MKHPQKTTSMKKERKKGGDLTECGEIVVARPTERSNSKAEGVCRELVFRDDVLV